RALRAHRGTSMAGGKTTSTAARKNRPPGERGPRRRWGSNAARRRRGPGPAPAPRKRPQERPSRFQRRTAARRSVTAGAHAPAGGEADRPPRQYASYAPPCLRGSSTGAGAIESPEIENQLASARSASGSDYAADELSVKKRNVMTATFPPRSA